MGRSMLNGQTDVVSFAVLLGLLSLIPLIVVTTTSFLKISLVLLVLRNAIGVQQVPPTLAIYGISLAMSVFIMAPTVQEIGKRVMAVETRNVDVRSAPMMEQAKQAFEPLRDFMLRFSKPEQREIFLNSAKKLWPKDVAREATSSDVLVLIPAFVVSELQTGYQIAFLIYIPFVVIDLLIGNLLMALGMQQVSPQTISIPLKLLLFVLVDGWGKLLNALAMSYL
ncbi:Type III secretion inner membrane protein (YscR,SpaR,HrcR,EscR,homologous to flagellar export components) [Collimonas arenae]|uniref:Type III secretion inner membrane protein (YscR,SpaR,HrcR,EscR,homologous to flagellar export components) n=2 Tax=Collimonas arenae TaxID=279058 RepID=A0A0A1F4M7_9BURK|nr:Type III secretion inner membrane protein (YscR,SpaR,HrcR,EscR,homologous to flagellar export components) [Collimonas arenae]